MDNIKANDLFHRLPDDSYNLVAAAATAHTVAIEYTLSLEARERLSQRKQRYLFITQPTQG